MTPPRVMVLTPWDRMWSLSGGGAPSWAYLIEGLLDAGFMLDVIAPPGDSPDYPDHPRLHVTRTAPLRSVHGPFARLRFWIQLTRALSSTARAHAREHGPPDVVYGFSAQGTPAASWCGWRWRRPAVGKLFGTFLAPVLDHPARLLAHWEEALGFRVPLAALVVHDDGTRGDEVARWLRVPDGRLRFWRNGVDRDACEAARQAAVPGALREEMGIAAGAPLIYAASRLVIWKRVDRIIKAMPGVLERHPDARLLVAGDGERLTALEQLASELGVADAVLFAGAVPRELNLRLMAAADVFCSTYDFSNLGNALHEAMSCAAAVVATDTGRTLELVQDGVSGLLVAPDDTAALACALSDVIGDAVLRERLRLGALQAATTLLPTKDERIGWEVEMVRELAEAR